MFAHCRHMYAGPEHPAWRAPGPGHPAPPPPQGPPQPRRLCLLLALLLFPLTAGLFTGAVVPLVLAFHPHAGWASFGPATAAALLLAAPTAHALAAALLRPRPDLFRGKVRQRD